MAFYTVQARTNYYVDIGEGRPVLLLHGISNSGRAWAPQVPDLKAAGYRAIVPDHAGHGASGAVTAPFGVQELANDVEALIAHLGLDEFDVVGLSLGGMVALELALRHPERIGRLIVANSFERTATPQFKALAEGWAKIFEQPHGPVLRLEQNWPSLVSPAFQETAEGLRTWQVWHGIAASADGPSLAHVARGITDFDRANDLGKLAMPTLFIAGDGDGMSPPDLSRAMAERAGDGICHVIAGAAHISNVDSADEFSRIMLQFLGRASSPAVSM
ncbi:alpha/beta fold hydrolase [Novosphingobium sp. 9]|uniref:alpha/beta fold hydrolase n=1 Tax=Novosphingobium sp. 9 TaxID=2025349 RepID=UPI0021B535D1|nr:alpha/beta hydrolase [Novosphingobium sp. 9]